MTTSSSSGTRMGRLYGKIARGSLYLLALLVPIMFLPWTTDPLEINKQTITLILISVSMIAWLGMMVVEKQFYVKKSWLFLLPVLFVLSVLVSSVLSLAPVTSWVGQGTQEYTSFISILAFALLFIVGAHFLSETRVQRMVWSLSFISSAIIGLFILLALVGLPIINTTFVGTPNALGLYLAAMSVIGSALWLVSNEKAADPVLPKSIFGAIVRISILVTVASALFVLLSIDFWALWVALIAGLAVVFTFALMRAEEFHHTSHFVLPMLLFVVALLFLFIPSLVPNRFPLEVAPSYGATWNIATDTLADTNWLFGSGPGTFVMDYTKHKIPEINATRLWDARFDRGNNHMFTSLATLGIVGVLLLLVFMACLKTHAMKMLLKEKAHDEWKMTFVAFSGWTVVAFGMFIYSSNFTLSFLFWLLSAVIASQVIRKAKHISFGASPRFALMTTFMFVLVSIGLLTLVFVSVSRYAAEIAFARAVQSDQTGEDIDEILVGLDTAARLNKSNDLYYRNLSSALLVKTAQLLTDPEADVNALSQMMQLTISSARRATEISPNYVVNWSALGDIYREFVPLAQGADLSAIAAYERAIELAPTNPKYYTAQARAYIIRSEQLIKFTESEDADTASAAEAAHDEAIQAAIDRLQEAIALKPDYAPAHYHLALAYERQGNLAESIASMEMLRDGNRLDVGIHFQLGLLYLKQGKNDLAQASLEQAIEIAPNYSNARWYLSAVYEQNSDFEAAIEQVEMIKALNPDNALIDQRLERLHTGQAEEELPEPLEEGEGGVTEIDEPVLVEEE